MKNYSFRVSKYSTRNRTDTYFYEKKMPHMQDLIYNHVLFHLTFLLFRGGTPLYILLLQSVRRKF